MNKKIWYNIVNSLIAGGLVFLGSMSTLLATDDLCLKSFLIGSGLALITASAVALNKFKDFWTSEEKEIVNSFFHFL